MKSAIIANPSNPDEVVEFSQDGDSFYLNGRGSEVKKVYAVTPSLGRTEILPDGKFRVEIDWRVDEPIPEGLRTFIHLYEAYLGYGHHPNGWVAGGDSPKIPTERWFSEKDAEEGEVVKTDFDQVLAVPEGILAGRYLVMVGLYDPESGKRLPMMGDDAGETRYAIGELIVKRSDGKTEIEINPLPPDEERNLFFRLRANSTPASFHGVSTLGGVVVTPEGDGTWSLLPIPVLSDFEVTLSEKEIGKRVGRIVSRGEEVPFQRDGVNGERVTFHVTAADAIRYQVVFE